MSDCRAKSLAPLVFACAFFISFVNPHNLQAQTEDCGTITDHFGDVHPIENCTNPFNVDAEFPFTTTVMINGQEVTEGSVITVAPGAAMIPVDLTIDPPVFLSYVQIYRHVGDSYEIVTGDPFFGSAEMQITEPGLYSAVIVAEDAPMPVHNTLFSRFATLLIPTAHAFYEDYQNVKQVTFTIEIGEENNPTSILFLPGIKASRLYTTRSIGTEDQLWEPTFNQDVSQLEMSTAGESINEIYTKDVIDSVLGVVDVYVDFLQYLDSAERDEMISDWHAFAYDWRYDVFDVVENGTPYENEVIFPAEIIEELTAENNSKVTIVAHSNGGLLAKALIEKLREDGKDGLVERVIFLGSPQLGTPMSIGSILHGYGEEIFGGLTVDDETARTVIRNVPGAYGLLPFHAFLESLDKPVVSFADSTLSEIYRDAYGDTIDSLSELSLFIKGEEGRPNAGTIEEPMRGNELMLDAAATYHSNILDEWEAPEHIEIIEIVGTGLDTVKGFRYEEFTRRECLFGVFACRDVAYLKPVPLFTKEGDQTVMAVSADAYQGDKETYYVDLAALHQSGETSIVHATLGESSVVQDILTAILLDQPINSAFVSTSQSSYDEERDIVSVHSPVSVAVTDDNGNEVKISGEGENARVVNEIPGSTYMEFAGGKYVVLPSDMNYEVNLHGEGEGSYTVRIDTVTSDGREKLFEYTGMTNSDMEASFEKSDTAFTPLSIDVDGDGEIDETIEIDDSNTASYTFADLYDAVDALDLRRGQKVALNVKVRVAERFSDRKDHWLFSRTYKRLLDNIARDLKRLEKRGRITGGEYEHINDIMKSL